ncbi:MAG: hypothetical protein ACOCS8_00305 [Desulfovermiculus sp.]
MTHDVTSTQQAEQAAMQPGPEEHAQAGPGPDQGGNPGPGPAQNSNPGPEQGGPLGGQPGPGPEQTHATHPPFHDPRFAAYGPGPGNTQQQVPGWPPPAGSTGPQAGHSIPPYGAYGPQAWPPYSPYGQQGADPRFFAQGFQGPPGYAQAQAHPGQAPGPDSGPGHPKHDAHRYGQVMGLINDVANGNADPSKVMQVLSSLDSQFWKGALIGVGATLLVTNETVKNALVSALSDLAGCFEQGSESAKIETK